VVWLDPYFERDTIVIAKVTAANLHGMVSKNFTPAKLVRKGHPSDLVDLNTLELKEIPHIWSLFDEALKKQNYDAIDWNRPIDDD
jgi:hypothetical protein